MNQSNSSFNSSVEMSTINGSKSSLDELDGSTVSDRELRKAIWGPFYYIAQATGLVLYISPEDMKTKRALFHLIPNALASLILFANSIYCIVRLSNVPFSINWVYSNSLLFLSIHGFVSSMVMMGFKYSNYFSNIATLLRKATRNNVSSCQNHK